MEKQAVIWYQVEHTVDPHVQSAKVHFTPDTTLEPTQCSIIYYESSKEALRHTDDLKRHAPEDFVEFKFVDDLHKENSKVPVFVREIKFSYDCWIKQMKKNKDKSWEKLGDTICQAFSTLIKGLLRAHTDKSYWVDVQQGIYITKDGFGKFSRFVDNPIDFDKALDHAVKHLVQMIRHVINQLGLVIPIWVDRCLKQLEHKNLSLKIASNAYWYVYLPLFWDDQEKLDFAMQMYALVMQSSCFDRSYLRLAFHQSTLHDWLMVQIKGKYDLLKDLPQQNMGSYKQIKPYTHDEDILTFFKDNIIHYNVPLGKSYGIPYKACNATPFDQVKTNKQIVDDFGVMYPGFFYELSYICHSYTELLEQHLQTARQLNKTRLQGRILAVQSQMSNNMVTLQKRYII